MNRWICTHSAPEALRAKAASALAEGDTREVERFNTWEASTTKRGREILPQRFRAVEMAASVPAHGLYLFGGVGVGKTHCAAAIIGKAVDEGAYCAWVSIPDHLAALRASFGGGPAPRTPDEIADNELIVLDDIGASKDGDWVRETLFHLVNTIYERERLLIVTSNLRLSELERQHGKRITSRIAELCDLQEMKGRDRRVVAAAERKQGETP